jgi:Rod binding domain-containing protein
MTALPPLAITRAPPRTEPVGVNTAPAAIRDAARSFEAMAIGALLAPMFETVDLSTGPFGGGAGEAAWRPMMIEAMAKSMSKAGGFGLGSAIEAALLRMREERG